RGADALLPGGLLRELQGLDGLRSAHPRAAGALRPAPSRRVAFARLRQPARPLHTPGAVGPDAGAPARRRAPDPARARALSGFLAPIAPGISRAADRRA